MNSYDVANIPLVRIECWWRSSSERCGRVFAVSEATNDWMREKGGSIYCPAGHLIRYGKSNEQELRDELTRERARLDQTRAMLETVRQQRNHQERRAQTYKGHLTRTKRRIAAGVCPCCHRTFQALARHMKNQHPAYEKSMA